MDRVSTTIFSSVAVVTRPCSRNIANLLLCAVSLSSTRKAAQRRVYCDRHERLGCYVRGRKGVCNGSTSTAQKRRTRPGPKACYHLGTAAIVITLLVLLANGRTAKFIAVAGTPLEYPRTTYRVTFSQF